MDPAMLRAIQAESHSTNASKNSQAGHISPWPRYLGNVSRYTSHLHRNTYAKANLLVGSRVNYTHSYEIHLPFVARDFCRSIGIRVSGTFPDYIAGWPFFFELISAKPDRKQLPSNYLVNRTSSCCRRIRCWKFSDRWHSSASRLHIPGELQASERNIIDERFL